MKKLLIVFAGMILMVGFTSGLFAQNSATTAAGAMIVQALTLNEVTSLHFGTMSIPTGAVNVSLSTMGVRSASVPANVTLLAQNPVAQNAIYLVSGSSETTYAITLPANNVVQITDGTNSMNVDDFVARTSSAGSDGLIGFLAEGTDSFVVGATLKLNNAQPAGVYSGTFNVAVNYN